MDWMPQAIREGIFTILFISGPLVILAAGLGLAIGIIQAATQVQEQTLGSAVKIIGLFIALIVFGFYMFQYVSRYTAENIKRAFKLVPSLGSYVLPRENFLTIPKEKDVLRPQAPPTTLKEPPVKTSGIPKTGEAVNEPDETTTRTTRPEDILNSARLNTQKTSAQRPTQNQVREQPLRPVTTTAPTPSRPPQAPAATTTRPVAQTTTTARPANPAPATTPSPTPTNNVSDRLSRLRSNINQPAAAGNP